MPVTDLGGPEGIAFCRAFMSRVQEIGTRPGTQEYEKAGSLISTTLDVAARDHLLTLPLGNPMQTVPFRVGHFTSKADRRAANVQYITEDLRPSTPRVDEFIARTRDLFGDVEAVYVRTMAYGGLRPGEANALTPRQVLAGAHDGLQIDQQVLELTASEAAASDGGTQQIRLPKWGRLRDAWIPPDLRRDLHEMAERRGHVAWKTKHSGPCDCRRLRVPARPPVAPTPPSGARSAVQAAPPWLVAFQP